jgi:hypothetical protein
VGKREGKEPGEEHTRITLVSIRLKRTLGGLEVILGDNLVQAVFTTAKHFAGVAMAFVSERLARDHFEVHVTERG